MAYDPNRNAKVIIPLAVGAWLGGILLTRDGVPASVRVIAVIAFALAVPAVVFYLMGAAGWKALARRHRARGPDRTDWQLCPTGQMAQVGVEHPDFHKVKMRFVGGTLRVATSPDALHLSTLGTRVPVLGWFFPRLAIPWSAVTNAHAFEAPGWFAPPSAPGASIQAAYDPGYTGRFVEMEIGDAGVFIQLPAAALGDGLARLPNL
jgi:hypothetical protein